MNDFILKGDIVYNRDKSSFRMIPDGYLICIDGQSAGVFEKIPGQYVSLPVFDYSNKLIIPGMTDLHIHAPQFAFRGMYMDSQLLEWLQKHVFPEESKFADIEYAEKAYGIFTDSMIKSSTSRLCVFGTAHSESTVLLMNKLEKSGLSAYVGKVNMDNGAPDSIREKNASESLKETERWIQLIDGKFNRVFPILTPRMVPSCTDELLEKLKNFELVNRLPVQSHLSENTGEVAIVRERFPNMSYGEVYDSFGLFGSVNKTIMAHCVLSSESEIDLMKKRGVFIAHCPASNTNLISGIAPIRRYLDLNLNVGLGTDIGAGHTESMFNAITECIQVSKIYNRYIDAESSPVSFAESFYLATCGGGSFFGKVGSFDSGYEFDAVVLDDSSLPHTLDLDLSERLERAVSLGLDCRGGIEAKYVAGKKIDL